MIVRTPPRGSTDSFQDRKWKEYVAKGEFTDAISFKSTAFDTFKVTQQFSTTAPTQYIFTSKTNNPNFYVRMPDGVNEPSTGEIGLPGGNASDLVFLIGSGGNTSDTEGSGGDAGKFIVKLGQGGSGGGGAGNTSLFIISDAANQTIFSASEGSTSVFGSLSVSGSLNLLGLPSITVTGASNNLPVTTIDNRAVCNSNTIAGFGNSWRFTTQADGAILETGAITNTLLTVSPHVHSRMIFTVRGQATFPEGFRFESDGTNDGVALCAFGGAAVASHKVLIYSQKAAYIGCAVRAHASQTANLQEWQNSSGTMQLAVAANGRDFVLETTTGTKIGTSTSQKLGFWNATPVVQNTGWNPTNVTTDRAFDASATTLAEIANVLGTLINQLKTYGLLG